MHYKAPSIVCKMHSALQKQFHRALDSKQQQRRALQADGAYARAVEDCMEVFKVTRDQPLPAGMDPQDNTELTDHLQHRPAVETAVPDV